MTKDTAKDLMNNPAIKLAGFVFTQTVLGCALYFGLRSEIRENKAAQIGRDNVQDVITGQNTKDIGALSLKVDQWISRDIKKPDPIRIEPQ